MRHGFIIGGTDSRASSPDVRVWFDGALGAPIGFPPSSVKLGAVLLFHASAESGRQGWFQPTIGCVSLTSKTKRSTVSAVATAPGTPAGSALDLHAENIFLRPERGVGVQKRTLRCPRGERPVGSWSAVALDTASPPASVYAHAATVNTAPRGQSSARPISSEQRVRTPCAPDLGPDRRHVPSLSNVLSLHHFSFGAPSRLFVLLVVPLFYVFAALIRRRRSRDTVAFTNLKLLGEVTANATHALGMASAGRPARTRVGGDRRRRWHGRASRWSRPIQARRSCCLRTSRDRWRPPTFCRSGSLRP